MPQGSVLGPLLFTLYSAPIASIVRRHGLIAHLYADDTQLYIVFDQDDAVDTIKRIEACVMEIKEWMAMNWLKLNDEMTLSLLLRTPTVGHLSNISDIITGDNNMAVDEPPCPTFSKNSTARSTDVSDANVGVGS